MTVWTIFVNHWRVIAPMYSAGRILQRRGSEKSDPRVSRRLERKSQAFGLAVDSIMEKLSRCRQMLEKIQPGCTLPRRRKKDKTVV